MQIFPDTCFRVDVILDSMQTQVAAQNKQVHTCTVSQ